jgi:hypothetical protein
MRIEVQIPQTVAYRLNSNDIGRELDRLLRIEEATMPSAGFKKRWVRDDLSTTTDYSRMAVFAVQTYIAESDPDGMKKFREAQKRRWAPYSRR